MTRKTAILLICTALAAGCHRTQTARRGNQNYQVVEEGQASGVTSTINAPGETPPPLTDTAIDTTTNFTLTDNPAPLGSLPPNTVAGSLPTYSPYPPAAAPRPRPAAPPPMSSATTPPPQPKQAPPTDTAVTDEVLPPTDTTATEAPKKEGEQTDTTKADTSTTTTTTNPPPPTPPV